MCIRYVVCCSDLSFNRLTGEVHGEANGVNAPPYTYVLQSDIDNVKNLINVVTAVS